MRRSILSPASFAFGLLFAGCTELRPLSESSVVAHDASVDGCLSSQGCSCFPTITSADVHTLAHGASVAFTGSCLTGATSLRIAGITQTFVVESDTRITVASVADATPTGLAESVVVTTPSATSGGFLAPVAHLVISELDTFTGAGQQRNQFVEIATGVNAALDLSDYAIVILDGADDGIHASPVGVVLGTTTTLGRYSVGGSKASGVQARIANDAFTTTTDAAAVVLIRGSTLPPATGSITELEPVMVDALVYATATVASDSGLLASCYPDVGERVQIAEDVRAMSATDSIRRCGDLRRSGNAFGVATATPGAANGCP